MNDHYELSKQNTNSSISSNGFFNIKRLILILLAFFAMNCIKAHHMIGGEISWICLPNGQYIFKMNLYRDCTGTSFFFNNQNLSYQGGTIILKPDSNLWLSYGGNGNISYKGPDGCQLNCGSPASWGSFQFHPYISDPVTLNGVPPPSGLTFTWTLCCRGNASNLSNGASESYTLRAKMYPYKGNNTNMCYDSSPKFEELPSFLFCKGVDLKYNINASDRDLDSLVFSFAEAWSNPNVPVIYASGYSYSSPLPDSNINPLNKAATINPHTGEIGFTTYGGFHFEEFNTVVRVDSYRDGIKISSIFRDAPIFSMSCPSLPGTNATNNPAVVSFNGMPSDGFSDTVFAGQKISVPVLSVESDIVYSIPTDPTTAHLQDNYVSPSGMMFSNDFIDSLACQNPNAAPCATLSPAPVLNQLNGEMELSGQGTVSTTFEWQTDCGHLVNDSVNFKSYHFVFKNYDETCTTPIINYPTMQVVVARYMPNISQNGNVLSVDPAQSYQWFYNGNPIPNSNSSSISISAVGIYSVELVKYGCKSQRANYHVLFVSLSENAMDWKSVLKVHPNPFRNGFQIEVPHPSSENLEFRMLDLRGREVESSITKSPKGYYLEVGKNLQQGIYILEIASENQSILKKMIKL